MGHTQRVKGGDQGHTATWPEAAARGGRGYTSSLPSRRFFAYKFPSILKLWDGEYFAKFRYRAAAVTETDL